MKKLISLALIVFVLCGALCSCSIDTADRFINKKVGEDFAWNRDGYFMKLPSNYCLCVLLGETTTLIHLSKEDCKKDFVADEVYNNKAILKKHFVYGYYNDNYLILCEEKEKEKYQYLSFNFETNQIKYYANKVEVLNLFNFKENDFFTLCNKYE